MITDEGVTWMLADIPRRCWQHEVREALRRWQWRRASEKRADMRGLEDGADRMATMRIMESHREADI
eukprot:7405037-Karenia_brevis.AAC.1